MDNYERIKSMNFEERELFQHIKEAVEKFNNSSSISRLNNQTNRERFAMEIRQFLEEIYGRNLPDVKIYDGGEGIIHVDFLPIMRALENDK